MEDLGSLVDCLQNTLFHDTAVVAAATKQLLAAHGTPGYPTALLTVVQDVAQYQGASLAAAIQLKNLAGKHWQIDGESGVDMVGEDDRQAVRANLIGVLLTAPKNIQRVLHDAVSAIAKVDYPTVWHTLMPELVARMQAEVEAQNLAALNPILEIIAALVTKYEGEFKTDALLTEMQYSLDYLQEPLLVLFTQIAAQIGTLNEDAAGLAAVFETLNTLARIFYSINCQELPDYFADHMPEWMEHFRKLLEYENPLVTPVSDMDPSWLVKLQGQICRICSMYTEVAEEEFNPTYLPTFVQVIWERLMKCSPAVSDDVLVTTAIKFLSSVASLAAHMAIFQAPETLRAICENVVLPAIHFRESDQNNFDVDPMEYLRCDLEGGEADTRRGAVTELIQSLCKNFLAPISELFLGYVTAMMGEYAAAPAAQWVLKDASMYLISAMTVLTSSARFGTSATNAFVDINSFFAEFVLPELTDGQPNHLPVIKTDCIKFVITFRNQISPAGVTAAMEAMVALLVSEEFLVQTYAAAAIGQILPVVSEGVKVFRPAVLQPYLETLLSSLFACLNESLGRIASENQYVMRAIMRALSAADTEIGALLELCIAKLTELLEIACRAPGNPQYSRFLFESIGVLIRNVCRAQPDVIGTFETMLFPSFTAVLSTPVEEFTPFVFQILSQMLEVHVGSIPALYMDLLPPLLAASMWEQSGSIPAMVRLLVAYVEASVAAVAAADQLESVFGVFRKLIQMNSLDTHGFTLLNALITVLPAAELAAFLPTVLRLLLGRLSESKTIKFSKGFVDFLVRFVLAHGSDGLIAAFEAIQPGLWRSVLAVVADFAPAIADSVDRKAATVALCELLTGSEAMLDQFSDMWTPVLGLTIDIFEERVAIIQPTKFEEDGGGIMDDSEYETAYAKLAYSYKMEKDLVPHVGNAKAYLVAKLVAVAPRIPFAAALSGLSHHNLVSLRGYFAEAGAEGEVPWPPPKPLVA